MESSCESLTMKMKPRPNMQVAAACWRLLQSGKQRCLWTPRDSKLFSRKEKGPQRHVIGGLLGEKKNWWRVWGGGRSWSSGGRSRFCWDRGPLPAPGSKEDNGSWALSPPRLLSQFSQSCPVLLWDGRKSQSCFVIQENTGAHTESLPSSVWMRRLLYLAEKV